VAKYTDLGKHEVCALADHYGLMLDGFKAIEGGARNSSYVLQSQQGEYVLTVFDDRSRADVDKLGRLLLLLEEHDFPATRLLQPEQGGITAMHGDKPVMMKEYIAGDVRRDLDLPMLSQAGASMATLHQLKIPDHLLECEPGTYLRLCNTSNTRTASSCLSKPHTKSSEYRISRACPLRRGLMSRSNQRSST
jgi:homoserine kinase type II